MVASGKFRMDLYYRLNTFEINIPPLRAHKQDIPLLIQHFIQQDGLELELSEDAKGMLMNYVWPGNVRELRNVLNRLSFLYPNMIIGIQQVYNATGEMFHLVDLPEYRDQTDPMPKPTMPKYGEAQAPKQETAEEPALSEFLEGNVLTMEEYEKRILQKAIAAADGNLTEAAKRLGISRASVYNKVKKYGL